MSDERPPTQAETAAIYAQAAQTFSQALTQNIANAMLPNITDKQRELFMTAAEAIAHRMQVEIDPRWHSTQVLKEGHDAPRTLQ